jgi:hypothetical protein
MRIWISIARWRTYGRADLMAGGVSTEPKGLCLASDDSSFITGTDIVVDGGWFSSAPYLGTERSQSSTTSTDVRVGCRTRARERIRSCGAAEQLLHGEPHPGNLLSTRDGLPFIDFERCCRGPVEFDVAHVPEEVSAHYPGVDYILLAECRRLVLAMVAAWRWDVRDEFPHGHQHGRDILLLLRQGPPWPALGALDAE